MTKSGKPLTLTNIINFIISLYLLLFSFRITVYVNVPHVFSAKKWNFYNNRGISVDYYRVDPW